MKLRQAIVLSNIRLRLLVAVMAILVTGLVVLAAEQRDAGSTDTAGSQVNQSQELRVYPV